MSTPLEIAAAAVDGHVGASGWDRPPMLFALVRTAEFAQTDPQTAARLGFDTADSDALTPVEQEALPPGELDEVLAQIAWPAAIAGCALSHEVLLLPATADGSGADDAVTDAGAAAAHPRRREARLVVAVLRDGSSAGLLRLRPTDDDAEELLTGADLAPNLATALLETLRGDPDEDVDEHESPAG